MFDGIKSGFMSGFIGSLIISVIFTFSSILSLVRGPMDFIGGFMILFCLILTAIALLFASIGAVIGVTIRSVWE